jgi:hypothetical protein
MPSPPATAIRHGPTSSYRAVAVGVRPGLRHYVGASELRAFGGDRKLASVELAFPRLKVCLAGRELTRAVSVDPDGGAALGVFLVSGLSLVVKFEDIGENSETGLHLGR